MTENIRTYRDPGTCIKCNCIIARIGWGVVEQEMIAGCENCGYQWTVKARDEMEEDE